jgi:hypothetical protein
MPRRALFLAILTITTSLTSMACGTPKEPTPVTSPTTAGSGTTDGFCGLISRTALEDAYGPMLLIHDDHGPITGDSVRGSCDYLVDKSNDYRVFFTINVGTDVNRETFEKILATAESTKMPMTDAEVFSVESSMVHLVAHKHSTTIDVGLRVGSAVADRDRDTALALQLLGQALSHY